MISFISAVDIHQKAAYEIKREILGNMMYNIFK